MECFWDNWNQSNNEWCEEKKCSFIVNPINTFSNIFYFLVGDYIYEYNKQIGLSMFFIGLMSSLYHLSDIMIFRILDLFSINVLYSVLLSNVMFRKTYITDQNGFNFIFLIYSSPLFISFEFIDKNIYFYYFFLLTLIIFCLELSFKFFNEVIYTSLFFLTTGFIFSMVDKNKIICDKNSYFQGHSLWHLLSSISVYFISIPQSIS